jgi:hypothetical protein
MKYRFALRWPESAIKDYDELIAIEKKLIENLSEVGEVDGHDAGLGEVAVFILTDDPKITFSEAMAILGDSDHWLSVRAAYREITQSHYIRLWPEDSSDFKII